MTPSEANDSDSSDSRKTFIIFFNLNLFIYYSYVLTCSVHSFGFFSFFSPSVVVVNLLAL